MASLALFHVGLFWLSAVLTATLAVYTYRAEEVPGRLWFSLFMVSITVWTGSFTLGMLVADRTLRIAFESTAWFGRATVHVWFLLFALAYTGYDRLFTRRTVAALLAPAVAMIALVWTNSYHGLVWTTGPRVVTFDGLTLLVATVGSAYWLTVVYAYVLIVAGSVLLVRLVVVSEHLYADQSLLVLVAIAAPFAGNVVTVFPPHPIPGLDYTPYGFTVTGLALGYTLFRGHLFDMVPATRALGRNAAIAQLDAGLLVVDTGRRVIYCNDAAGDVFGHVPADVLGRQADDLVADVDLDFATQDAFAEFERADRIYEIRTSPITDRRDRLIGHTVVVHDVTARKRRVEELALLDDVNRVIRGVNRSLVSATNRAEIEQALCDRVIGADIYRRACVGDVSTWTGSAERWTVAGEGGDPTPPALDGESPGDGPFEPERLATETGEDVLTVDSRGGTWVVVPLVYGRTVYGALGLYTDRETIDERERAVLAELGETVGYAIDAAETRLLLAADEVVELEFESTDPDAPLVAAAGATSGRVEVTALSPQGDGSHIAYVQVEGGDSSAVRDEIVTTPSAAVRTVRDSDGTALFEWQLTGDSLLGTLADEGAHVRRAAGVDGGVRYELDLPSHNALRSLVENVQERFPETQVVAKRKRSHPVEREGLPADLDLDGLTDRQREVMEVAYRAGYFNWPRDSSAEEVAETLDISSPTLLHHIRTAQKQLVDDVFGSGSEDHRLESED